MSRLQNYYLFKLDFQNVDQYTGGKWLIKFGVCFQTYASRQHIYVTQSKKHNSMNYNQCLCVPLNYLVALQWRHNGREGVSNHQPHHCLLNRSFRRRSKKYQILRIIGLCDGNWSVGPVNSPHKWPVTRKSYLMTSSCTQVWKPYGSLDVEFIGTVAFWTFGILIL